MVYANQRLLLPLVMLIASVVPVTAQVDDGRQLADSLEASIRLDRGEGTTVEAGDEVRIYYRVSADAYVAIFRVNTEGRVDLLMPQHPNADVFASGGREYRLLLEEGRQWAVADAPGEGSFFMIASPEPLDFTSFLFDSDTGWDLTGAGSVAYEDPYEAIDDYVIAVLPDWDRVAYALDFEPYEVVEADANDRTPSATVPSAPRSRVVVVRSPAPRYRVPAPVVRWRMYARAPHYGPPPPRVRGCCAGRGYYAPRPPHYGPPPHSAPRYRPAPPRYPPAVRPPHPGRPRYKERPRRRRG